MFIKNLFRVFIFLITIGFFSIVLTSEALAAVSIRIDKVNSPSWPSPGDKVSVDLYIDNNTASPIYAMSVKVSYRVDVDGTLVTGYLDPDDPEEEVAGIPAYGDKTLTAFLPVGVTPGGCDNTSAKIWAKARLFYWQGGLSFGTSSSEVRKSVTAIGAALWGTVKKPDGTTVNGATVTLSPVDGSDGSYTTETSGYYEFKRINCTSSHNLCAKQGGWSGCVSNVSSGNPNAFICNGDWRRIDIKIYPPASPSPSPSSSASPSPSASASPSPSPTPAAGSVTLDPSCPSSTPTLSASWSLAAGSGYNIYVSAVVGGANRDCQISTSQSGSKTLTGTICSDTDKAIGIVDGGIYDLYGSNGYTTESDTSNTISCGNGGNGGGDKCVQFKCFTGDLECYQTSYKWQNPDDCTSSWCDDNEPDDDGWPYCDSSSACEYYEDASKCDDDPPTPTPTPTPTPSCYKNDRIIFEPSPHEKGDEVMVRWRSDHGNTDVGIEVFEPPNWNTTVDVTEVDNSVTCPLKPGVERENQWCWTFVAERNGAYKVKTFWIKDGETVTADCPKASTCDNRDLMEFIPVASPDPDPGVEIKVSSKANPAYTWTDLHKGKIPVPAPSPDSCASPAPGYNDCWRYLDTNLKKGDNNYTLYINEGPPHGGSEEPNINQVCRIGTYYNPIITPWIQVTGDVHSNVRINAPGGP